MWLCCVVVTGIGTSVSYHIAFAGSALNKRQDFVKFKGLEFVLLFRRIFVNDDNNKDGEKVDSRSVNHRESTG